MLATSPELYPLPEIERYEPCESPHFHLFIAPCGVLLVPITTIAKALCLSIDETPTVTLAYEAAANLLCEISKGDN